MLIPLEVTSGPLHTLNRLQNADVVECYEMDRDYNASLREITIFSLHQYEINLKPVSYSTIK